MLRYEGDGHATVVGSWRDAGMVGMPLGASLDLDAFGRPRVYRSGEPERIDDYDDAPAARSPSSCAPSATASSVAAPLFVAGRLWGVLVASMTRRERLPAGAERRLLDFAELVAQALSNADAYDKLAASRARIVEAGRRRAAAAGAQPPRRRPAAARVARAPAAHGRGAASRAIPRAPARISPRRASSSKYALDELRELARGIHPAILTDGGLARALAALAAPAPCRSRSTTCPTSACPSPSRRPPTTSIAEAITNVAKHANATHVAVSVRRDDGRVVVGSPTTAWAAPTRAPAPACTASPTASRRSTGTCASRARPAAARAWRRASVLT